MKNGDKPFLEARIRQLKRTKAIQEMTGNKTGVKATNKSIATIKGWLKEL